MKNLLVYILYCHFILASHLDRNESEKEKSPFEKLPPDHVNEIMGHLNENDKVQLVKTSKEFLQYDPREVVLKLPLKESKTPSKFVCDHLKTRKKLAIQLKKDDGSLFYNYNSLTKKYLECLTGIEDLRFGEDKDHVFISPNRNFNLKEFFPKLKHLEFAFIGEIPIDSIPNELKSLKLNLKPDLFDAYEKLNEKVTQMDQLEMLHLHIYALIDKNVPFSFSPMISRLNTLPNFKRLSIYYVGDMHRIKNILAQTQQIKYLIDLIISIEYNNDIDSLIEILPKTTESLHLNYYSISDEKKACAHLSTLNHLKKLTLIPRHNQNFNCLFTSLPPTLNELTYDLNLEISDVNEIILPKNLYYADLYGVKSSVFELFANHVQVLTATISDPENLLKIKKPFTAVKNLKFKYPLIETPIDFWFHILHLLPMEMDNLSIITGYLKKNDFYKLEKRIFFIKKKIKLLYLHFSSVAESLLAEFIFDGLKMTLKEKHNFNGYVPTWII